VLAGAAIVLLGDSIFDNKACVGSQPPGIDHLRSLLPAAGRRRYPGFQPITSTWMLAKNASGCSPHCRTVVFSCSMVGRSAHP
jgi:hypothetical protein